MCPCSPSQLGAATLGTDAYSYSYDNIGNRKTAQEAAEEATAYDANNLNQYTAIQEGTAEAFVPTFDADGNQTKVKTSTGIWNVVYNAENRPVTFTSEDSATIVECTYDKAPEGPEGDWTNAQRLPEGRGAVGRLRVNMGRRHTRRVTVNGSVTNYLRYIYRGYLQIAAINAVSGVFQWFIRRESARRPPKGRLREQAVRAIGQTRSVCPAGARSREAAPSQVFSSGGTILTAYTYTPYGAVTANGNVSQPIQWSSEYNDSELGLVYYNYRHYNPTDGRWTGRDRIRETISFGSVYDYVKNNPSIMFDYQGSFAIVIPLIPSIYYIAALVASSVVLVGYLVSEYADNVDEAIDDVFEEKEDNPFPIERCELECMSRLNGCNQRASYACKNKKSLYWAERACLQAYNSCLIDCAVGKWPSEMNRFPH